MFEKYFDKFLYKNITKYDKTSIYFGASRKMLNHSAPNNSSSEIKKSELYHKIITFNR